MKRPCCFSTGLSLWLRCRLLCGCRVTISDRQYSRSSYHQDSVRQQTIRYDSIYIDHWRTVRQQADTVYDETIRYEYRYQLLHDTVRIVQVDTVSVLQEVEVVKEITTPLTWFDRLSRPTFLLVVGLLSAYLLRSVVQRWLSRS